MTADAAARAPKVTLEQIRAAHPDITVKVLGSGFELPEGYRHIGMNAEGWPVFEVDEAEDA